MFEKEAHEVQKQIQQEYLDLGKNGAYPPLWERIGELWSKGAEFGYLQAQNTITQCNRMALQGHASEMDVYLRRAMVLLRRLVYLSSHGYHIEYPTAFNRYVTQAEQLLKEFKTKGGNK